MSPIPTPGSAAACATATTSGTSSPAITATAWARPAWSPSLSARPARLGWAVHRVGADFWVNDNFGRVLQKLSPPDRDEAVHFLTAAVALRP